MPQLLPVRSGHCEYVIRRTENAKGTLLSLRLARINQSSSGVSLASLHSDESDSQQNRKSLSKRRCALLRLFNDEEGGSAPFFFLLFAFSVSFIVSFSVFLAAIFACLLVSSYLRFFFSPHTNHTYFTHDLLLLLFSPPPPYLVSFFLRFS